MKITALNVFAVKPRWVLVKITTDSGCVGWGECLGDKAMVVMEAVRSFEDALLGEDPRRITHHWQVLYRGAFWRGGPILCAAISGVEMAMWDILGKSLGVPVWQLLGGAVRDRIRMYTRANGASPAELALSAKAAVARGFTALKFCPFEQVQIIDHFSVVEEAAGRVAAVREAIGSGIDILLDFHGRVSPSMAIWMEQAMREFHPMFIEEPVLPENSGALVDVARHYVTPIATGERLFTKWGFREVLRERSAAVLQPDPCICGGIQETRAVGAMAEVEYRALAPHNPYGPLNLAACLHVDAATPNFLVQEFVDPAGLGAGLLVNPWKVEPDGTILLPQEPGLGVQPDELWIAENGIGRLKDPGRWYHSFDGSMADW